MLRIIVAAWFACMTMVAAAAEKRVALVIGNSAYLNVPQLSNPKSDATALAKALRDTGFEVQFEQDLGQADMLKALRRFERTANDADWALVYYAGHGIEVAGTNYLVPVDAKLESDRDVAEEAVPLDRVLARLDGARKLRLVILDACRNDPFNKMKRTLASRDVSRGLGRVEPDVGTLVAFAAKAGSTASDGKNAGGNSPYAAALIKNLATPDVEVDFFFRRVRADVLQATERQQDPATYGQLPAERYIMHPGTSAPTVTAALSVPPPKGVLVPNIDDATNLFNIALSRDGRRLVTAGENKTPKLWDVASGRLLRSFAGHTGGVYSVALSPDGRQLASSGEDETIRLWDVESGRLLRTLSGHKGGIFSVVFSPDGRRLASGGEDAVVRLWDVGSGRLAKSFQGHKRGIFNVVFSPDGSRLVSGSNGGEKDLVLAIWDVESGRLVRSLEGQQGPIYALALSPDGKRLASGSGADGTVKLWDAESGRVLRSQMGYGAPRSIAFSADGLLLAVGSSDSSLKLWNVATGALVKSFSGHTNDVISIAFGAGDSRLVSSGMDKVVKVWDTATSQAVETMIAFSDGEFVTLLPNGQYAASSGASGHIAVLDNGKSRPVDETFRRAFEVR